VALSYPLDMRTMLWDAGIRFHRPVWRLEPRIATAALPGGLQVLETGPAIWRATWRTTPLRHTEAGIVEAFLEALAGAKRFLAFDPFRPWPAAHLAGAGLSGAQTFNLSAATPSRITLSGAAGLTLRTGDRVGLQEASGDPRYALLRVLETATAAGGSLAVDVAPQVPAHFGSGDVVRIYRPVCPMILDPSGAPSFDDRMNRVEWTFSGVQAA
jgi:hypothetical protein